MKDSRILVSSLIAASSVSLFATPPDKEGADDTAIEFTFLWKEARRRKT